MLLILTLLLHMPFVRRLRAPALLSLEKRRFLEQEDGLETSWGPFQPELSN